jgi:hypothetical protein
MGISVKRLEELLSSKPMVGLAVGVPVETTMGLVGLVVAQVLRLVRLDQNMGQPIQTQQFKAQPLETVWEGVVLAAQTKAPLASAQNTVVVVVAVGAMVAHHKMLEVPYTVGEAVVEGLVWHQGIRS